MNCWLNSSPIATTRGNLCRTLLSQANPAWSNGDHPSWPPERAGSAELTHQTELGSTSGTAIPACIPSRDELVTPMADLLIRTRYSAPVRRVLICDDRPAARKALAQLLKTGLRGRGHRRGGGRWGHLGGRVRRSPPRNWC